MLKQVLEQKKALLEALEAEEKATIDLASCVAKTKQAVANAGKDVDRTHLALFEETMHKILTKKCGSGQYLPQLYIHCQNLMEEIEKIRGDSGSSTMNPATEPRKVTTSPTPSNSSKPSTTSQQKSSGNAQQQKNGNASTSLSSPSKTATTTTEPRKTLKPNILKMASLPKLMELLEKSENDVDNMIIILNVLKEYKVTKKLLQETGAGKKIASYSKHELRKIAKLAMEVMAVWKDACKNPPSASASKSHVVSSNIGRNFPKKGESKKDKKGKGIEPPKQQSTLKLTDEQKAAMKKLELLRAEKKEKQQAKSSSSKDETDSFEDFYAFEKDRDRSSSKSKKLDNSSDDGPRRKKSKGGQEDEMEAYMRRLQSSFNAYEKEEAYSSYVGHREDLEAELDEKKAIKKIKKSR